MSDQNRKTPLPDNTFGRAEPAESRSEEQSIAVEQFDEEPPAEAEPANLPAVVVQAPDWRTLDQAPHHKPVILFCPYTESPDGTGAHPDAKAAHCRIVGWWSDQEQHWVSKLPGGKEVRVYPSRWAELLDEPTKGQ